MIDRRIGFVGAGTMGEALIGGMLKAGVAEASRLCAADASADRRQAVAQRFGIETLADNLEVVRAADVVVLAVKPSVIPVVGRQVAGALTPGHLLVSIAAGVSLAQLAESFAHERAVRVMPNTPALVGEGACAYCTGPAATGDDAAVVEQMLGAVGLCVRVEEKHMDAVTGLSGSGPAYLYMAIEALSDGGVKMGLARQVATKLAAQTVLGAGQMVLQTGEHPGTLKDRVTTPGGTTIEGVHALEAAGMRKAFIDAVVAATQKCRQLRGD